MLFIPIKHQEKLLKKNRKKLAIQKTEEIADKYDDLNKTGTANTK